MATQCSVDKNAWKRSSVEWSGGRLSFFACIVHSDRVSQHDDGWDSDKFGAYFRLHRVKIDEKTQWSWDKTELERHCGEALRRCAVESRCGGGSADMLLKKTEELWDLVIPYATTTPIQKATASEWMSECGRAVFPLRVLSTSLIRCMGKCILHMFQIIDILTNETSHSRNWVHASKRIYEKLRSYQRNIQ